jgi:hypothetical protein
VLVRRLLILAVVLVLLTALAAAIAPQERVEPGTPVQQPAKVLEPTGKTVARTISADDGGESSVKVRRGDILELQVKGDLLDTVLLERLDRLEGLEPTTPARFNMLIEAPAGTYPIRLLERDTRIGRIEVSD